MLKSENKEKVFLIKMSKKNRVINFILCLFLAGILTLILYLKDKDFHALIFDFILFFMLGYRAIEILITHKSIPLARLVYGRYREGRFAVVDFISYFVVVILYFTYNLLK